MIDTVDSGCRRRKKKNTNKIHVKRERERERGTDLVRRNTEID